MTLSGRESRQWQMAPGPTARTGTVPVAAPLCMPSLLARDAGELYAKNLGALLALRMKDRVAV